MSCELAKIRDSCLPDLGSDAQRKQLKKATRNGSPLGGESNERTKRVMGRMRRTVGHRLHASNGYHTVTIPLSSFIRELH